MSDFVQVVVLLALVGLVAMGVRARFRARASGQNLEIGVQPESGEETSNT